MTSRAKRITELSATTSISATDLLIIEKVNGANTSTTTITGSNLKTAMVTGPYADDAAAASGGVAVGEMYFVAAGDVKVRLV